MGHFSLVSHTLLPPRFKRGGSGTSCSAPLRHAVSDVSCPVLMWAGMTSDVSDWSGTEYVMTYVHEDERSCA